MTLLLLVGAAAVGAALGMTWRVLAIERSMVRAASANLQRGLAGRTLPTADPPARLTGLLGRPIQLLVRHLARRTRRFTPTARLETLEGRIATAGLQGRWTVEGVLAAKAGATVLAAVISVLWVAGSPGLGTVLLAAGGVAGAWYVPDLVLRGRADERRGLLLRELPDVVDRLCLTVDAGLGFESALHRTARAADGVLGQELLRAIQDIQLGARRADALQALADRCGVPELRRIVSSLRQAEEFGVPVAQVLRSESDALRDRQVQLAEEKAQKLPVKILFPLVFCVLPALLIVVVGPAVTRFSGGLGG